MLRPVGIALTCFVLLGACAQNEPKSSPKPSVDIKRLQRDSSKSVPSHLTIDAKGAVMVHDESDTDLRIVTFDPGPQLASSRLLSVGMEKFRDISDGVKIRAYVDLVAFDVKAGTYTLPQSNTGKAVSNPVASGGLETARALSKAYLAYYRTDAETKKVVSAFEFQRVVEPCRLIVGEKARSGMLTCPKLADQTGKTIEFAMSWKGRP